MIRIIILFIEKYMKQISGARRKFYLILPLSIMILSCSCSITDSDNPSRSNYSLFLDGGITLTVITPVPVVLDIMGDKEGYPPGSKVDLIIIEGALGKEQTADISFKSDSPFEKDYKIAFVSETNNWVPVSTLLKEDDTVLSATVDHFSVWSVVSDITPPTVIETYPEDEASDVSINSSISVTFSEVMDSSTITTATFILNDGEDDVEGSVEYSGVKAVFTPSEILDYSKTYTAMVTTDITDIAGIPLETDYEWTFITETESFSGAIIADHTIVNMVRLDQIPESAIITAKNTLHIAYDHTSHGQQLVEGMTVLPDFKEANGGTAGLYDFNEGGAGGALDLDDFFSDVPDLGYYPDWVYATREYLGWECETPGYYSTGTPNYTSDCNVIIWSWCWLHATETDITNYLNAMDQLREDYPEVQFVYMTAHSNGTGESGEVHYWNRYIRQYCIDNELILYDFYDIEIYDPDGDYFGDQRVNDGCYYDNDPPYDEGTLDGNWAIEWQNSHELGVDWFECSSAHSQPLNANMKAYAAWWLFARLAGWDGD